MLKSERNKQEGHQVILLIYNNLRAVSKSIVMEITDPGQAGSAIAGKCNIPGGNGAHGSAAIWTPGRGRRGDRINRTCALNYS
ncbi:MAG: hypothetical protein DME32_11800 [Verrucomicrobia bacterium]|nr:MAG: hypothetical protein DME32_11800 [Verrucomicrobiota bacterium]